MVYFIGSLAVWVILLHGESCTLGPKKSFAVTDEDRANRCIELFGCCNGVCCFLALWRHEIQNQSKWLVRLFDHVDGLNHRHGVKNGGLSGKQREVCAFGRLEGDVTRYGRTVNDRKVCTCSFGRFEHGRQSDSLDGFNSGSIGFSYILPERCCGLWIEIENSCAFASCFGSDGETGGEGGFPNSSFLGKNGQNFHEFSCQNGLKIDSRIRL